MQQEKSSLKSLVMWFCMVGFYFYAFIARSSFVTVLANDFMNFYAIDAAGLSILGSCYYWIYTGMQIPVGLICDKFSLRKTAAFMCFTTAVGVLLIVLTHEFFVAAIGEIIIGFGSAFAFILCLKVITAWFPESKVAIMTAYTMSLGAFGPVVGGPAVSLITKNVDWRTVIMIHAAIGVFLAVTIWSIVRDKEASANNEKAENAVSITDALRQIVRSKQIWALSFFTMGLYAPLSALGDLWGVSFAEKVFNLDHVSAAVASNMLYVGLVVGCPLWASFAMYLNSYKKAMIIGIIGAAVCLGISVIVPGLPGVTAFIILLITGFCTGAMLSYPPAIALFPKTMSATVSGFINMMSMVSGIILMPLFGAILNLSWDGTMENGIKVYSAEDFKAGVLAVVIFISIGAIISFFIKDRSPRTGEYI